MAKVFIILELEAAQHENAQALTTFLVTVVSAKQI
jgi:hypothetical protein